MLTLKQERFAQALATQETTQADAYRQAYNAENMCDNAIYREASLLAKNPKVAKRVERIRKEHALIQAWSAARLVGTALEAYERASELRQMGPAVQALALAGRILGHDVAHKRTDTDITIRVVRDEDNHTSLEAVDADGVRLLSTSIESDNVEDE